MKVDCQQYRKSMELIALREKLYKENPELAERKKLEERIKILETELDIN